MKVLLSFMFCSFLTSLNCNIALSQDGLPLKVRYHSRNGSTWVLTEDMVIGSDVSFHAAYPRGFNNKPTPNKSAAFRFSTWHDALIWHKVPFVEIHYDNQSMKLDFIYGSRENGFVDGRNYRFLEFLEVPVPPHLYKEFVTARTLSFTINNVRFSIEDSNLAALRTLHESRQWKTSEIVKRTTLPSQKLRASQHKSVHSALRSIRKTEALIIGIVTGSKG
jgi:hypothetical protein